MCRASVSFARKFDNSNKLDLLDFHASQLRAQFPDITLEALMKELHVVDDRGHVWRGARAINQILREQHGLRGAAAWLWYIPGFAWLADRQYRHLAGSRYGSRDIRRYSG
jgi:predicted DCC family thiol-disulfide oxidoreductase YuxK